MVADYQTIAAKAAFAAGADLILGHHAHIPKAIGLFADAVKYMDWTSEGHDHNFSVQGNEVVIATGKAAA